MSFRQRISHELRAEVGARLRLLREERHISQEEIAFAAEVTQASISNYENGRNEIPLSVLLSVCDFLNVPLSEMLPMANLYGAPREVPAGAAASWRQQPAAAGAANDVFWPV
ncbi:MAG: helix-turn-helix domain-containing protein [Dehalococcoidia bacterium]